MRRKLYENKVQVEKYIEPLKELAREILKYQDRALQDPDFYKVFYSIYLPFKYILCGQNTYKDENSAANANSFTSEIKLLANKKLFHPKEIMTILLHETEHSIDSLNQNEKLTGVGLKIKGECDDTTLFAINYILYILWGETEKNAWATQMLTDMEGYNKTLEFVGKCIMYLIHNSNFEENHPIWYKCRGLLINRKNGIFQNNKQIKDILKKCYFIDAGKDINDTMKKQVAWKVRNHFIKASIHKIKQWKKVNERKKMYYANNNKLDAIIAEAIRKYIK